MDEAAVLLSVTKLADLVSSAKTGETHAEINAKAAIELGAYFVVSLLLDKWIEAPNIVDRTLDLLTNLSYQDESLSRPFLQLRLLEHVLLALGNPEASIATHGLGAIGNMLATDKIATHFALSLKGIVTTIATMNTFIAYVAVQRAGAHVLGYVLKCQQFRSTFIAAGGIQALGNAMKRFQNDEELDVLVSEAFVRLSKGASNPTTLSTVPTMPCVSLQQMRQSRLSFISCFTRIARAMTRPLS